MRLFVTATLVILFATLSPLSHAINCTSPNDRNLTSQADVDKWLTRGPAGCDTVAGNLTLNAASITDISALSGIVEITGNLLIRNTSLADLDNLSTLNRVGGNLQIRNNDLLTELDGLTNLQETGGYLLVRENDNIVHVDGLDSLGSVGGYIQFNNNNSLTNLDGLAQISSTGGRLQISNNRSLSNIDGLGQITSVGGRLQVSNNRFLLDLDGLAQVVSIGDRLQISNNRRLQNIDGLSGITSVSANLIIRNNDDLQDVDGLASVVHVGGNLVVDRSADLTQCTALIPLLDPIDDGVAGPNGGAVDVGGTVTINGNGGATCNSAAGILDSVVLPQFSQFAVPDLISVSGTITGSTLTFSIDNSGSIVRATELNFTDNLPGGIAVSLPVTASTTCSGGTLTAGAGQISYTDGLVMAGAICTVQVEVTANAGGQFTNTTGDMTFTLGNSGPSSAIITVDDTPPVITVNGDNPLSLFVGEAFSDPGATATDDPGNSPVPVISSNDVDSSMAGSYTVWYDAVDSVGNAAAQQMRTVEVIIPPTPALELSVDILDFGDIVVGQTSPDEVVTLANTGDAMLSITSLGSVNPPFSSAAGSCGPVPFDLPPGASCTLQYGYSPADVGSGEQDIDIASNAASSPDSLTLRGNGRLPAATAVPVDSPLMLILTVAGICLLAMKQYFLQWYRRPDLNRHAREGIGF